MPEDTLRVRVEADVSQLANLTAKLQQSGLTATETASALKNLGYSSTEAAGALGILTTTTTESSVAMTGLDRAAAMATARIAAMDAGVGGLGYAMGRVAAMSSTLGPILNAAFPVLAVIAIGQVIDGVGEKLEELIDKQEKEREAWVKIDHEAATSLESETTAMNSLEEKITELTDGKLAALDLKLKLVSDHAVQLAGSVDAILTATGKELDSERSILDKAGSALKAIVDFAMGQQGAAIIQLTAPTLGGQASAFGASLKEKLDTEGTAAGLKMVDEELNRLYQQSKNTPDDAALKQYIKQLKNVQAILAEGLTRETLEQDQDRLEIAKEASAEEEKRQKFIEKIADVKAKLQEETRKAFAENEKEESRFHENSVHEYLNAGEQEVEATKSGSQERVDIYQTEVAFLKKAQSEALATMVANERAGNAAAQAADSEYYDAITKLLDQYQRKFIAASRERTESIHREAIESLKANTDAQVRGIGEVGEVKVRGYEEATRQVRELGRAHQESQSEITAALKAIEFAKGQQTESFLNDEKRIRQAELETMKALDAEPKELQKVQLEIQEIDNKIVASKQAVNQKIKALDDDMAIHQQVVWGTAMNKMETSFNKMLASVATGQTTLTAAWSNLWRSMTSTMTENLLKMVEQEAVALIQHKGMLTTEILGDAKASAAHAYQWVMASVPFPVNAVLAPAAAAAAFSAVMAFGAFEQGGIVGQTGLAKVHEQEMVLPKHISNFIQSAAANYSSTSTNTTAIGGDTHFHGDMHFHNGPDGGIRTEAQFAEMLGRAQRRGHFSTKRFGT